MNTTISLTITSEPALIAEIQNLSVTQQVELGHHIATTIQEKLTYAANRQLEVTFANQPTENKFDAAISLVQLISADFEGKLYPFATALARQVQEYLKLPSGISESRLEALNMEMHQLMTAVARIYARTGKWQ